MVNKNTINIAMIAYTNLSTDSRVIREALAAKEAGFNVYIYTLKERTKFSLDSINILSSKRKQYKGNNKFNFILSYLSFFFYLLIHFTKSPKKYKIIHVNNMPNFLVFCCIIPKLFGTKIILDIHDLVPEVFAAKFNMSLDHFLIKLLYFEERISANFVNEIISTNRFHTKRLIKNGIKKKRFTEVINAADPGIYKPVEKRDFSSKDITVVFPTTIAKHLGIDTLVDAAKKIKNRNVKVTFRIFGGGEYRNEIITKVDKMELNDYIEFSKGFISPSELSRELDNSHIGIIPWPKNVSTNYQMPNKIHEYFIKHLCVVASDVKILKEYFPNCICFFKAGDANDLANKIIVLLKNRKEMKRLADKGYAFYEKNTWNIYKKKYINLLESLI